MMNSQKSRSTIAANAALAMVNYTPAGNERTRLGRVGQNQLKAIVAGRQAVVRLKELAKDMEREVARAEQLVIDALHEGVPVADGLITPSIEQKTKFARISWKGAVEAMCKRFKIRFEDEHAELKAAVEPGNEVFDALKLSQ